MQGDGRKTIALERMSCDDARRYAESIIDSLREALLVLDDSLRVVSANRSFYRRFHVAEHETEGRLIYELGNRQWDIPALRHLLEALISHHESFEDFEVRQRFERIGERVMLLNARRVGQADGKPGLILLAIEDVTERYDGWRRLEVEEALRHKTAQLEATIDSLPDGYILYNRDGTIRRMNAVARQVLGFTEEEHRLPYVERMALLRIETPTGEPFPLDRIPSHRALSFGEIHRDVIMRVRRGERDYWISVSAAPIRDPEGAIHGAVMEFSDITKLRGLQEQLAGERNFVDAILQTSGALVAVLTSDGRFVRFNRECEQLTGYSAEEAGSLSVIDQLIPEEERAGVREVMARLFAGESLVEHENHWVSRFGQKRYIRWRNTALRDEDGGIIFAIATGIDITDRKRLEEELDRRARELGAVNRELESFSYSVSHDLRNPLTAIGSFTTFLQEDYAEVLDEEGREFLRRIEAGIKKMQRLIESLLILSRIGRQEMARAEVDLGTMVRDFLRELGSTNPERRVELVVQGELHAEADPRLMAVALENLLRNAWKFTATREVARIEFGMSECDGERVFYVRDNGVGFDARFAERIFEPFKRVHAEREFGGTGVGLSIVQRVISRHGGRVWATGAVDKGATFYFTLG